MVVKVVDGQGGHVICEAHGLHMYLWSFRQATNTTIINNKEKVIFVSHTFIIVTLWEKKEQALTSNKVI